MLAAMETGITALSPVLTQRQTNRKLFFFLIGLVILALAFVMPLPSGMQPKAMLTLGVMIVTVLWWVTEALPVPVTAMMVPVLLHVVGIVKLDKSLGEAFGDSFVPFLIGVLALSVAFTRSGLGKRITYLLLSLSGTKVNSVIAIYLMVSYVVSMFITDIAVVAMMLPITVGLLRSANIKPGESNFGRAMMMAIMLGSTLGGIATPSGVSANIITMSFLKKDAGITVSFLEWTIIATPISLAITGAAYWLILKLFKPEISVLPFGKERIVEELRSMGRWTTQEISTLIIFLVGVALWLSGDWNKLPIALVSLIILGLLSVPRLGAFDSWGPIEKGIEWGALLLVVGGFTLGVAVKSSGLAAWVALTALGPMATLPVELQPLAVTLLVAIDSLGFSSFGASAAVNAPFVIAYAQEHNFPVLALALASGFAASTHFILVTESPSFVLPYAYGYFSFKDLFKIGSILTVISAVFISVGLVAFGLPAGTVVAKPVAAAVAIAKPAPTPAVAPAVK
jgi:sodium-dependent dicarboxylate transporter 2/3/5